VLACYFEDGIEFVGVGINPEGQLKVLEIIVKVLAQVDLNESLIETVDLIHHLHELYYLGA
jgi:hypothetical protein